jgi:ABC-type Fe3+ transport system substrate-binding protein
MTTLTVFAPGSIVPVHQVLCEGFATVAQKRARGEIGEELRAMRDGISNEQIDAAIVYITSLGAFNSLAQIVLQPPFDLAQRIVFGAGAVVRDGRMHPAAAQFIDFLVGSPGQKLLVEAGFLPRSHAMTL